MRVWQALLLIVPAGAALGFAGGYLARPVMPQPAAEPWQAQFETRAQRYGAAQSSAELPEGPMTYVGGYSYPPGLGDEAPGYAGGERAYADAPLPTVAELDARQAELLADPDVEFAVSPPSPIEPVADPAPARAAQVADLGPEPRTADGKLPAIW